MGGVHVTWWTIERGLGRRALGRTVAIGIVSHLVLDVATHAPDIALWPGSPFPQLGLGLYNGAPSAAFVVELLYGVLCWWIYRGSRALLSVLVAGNVANMSFFFAGMPGPEQFLAGHPLLVVTVIFVQIVTMLVLVGLLSSKGPALLTADGSRPPVFHVSGSARYLESVSQPIRGIRRSSDPDRAAGRFCR